MSTLKHLLLTFFIISFVGLPFWQSTHAQDTQSIQIEDPTQTLARQFEIRGLTISGLQTGRETFLLNTSGLNVGDTIEIPGESIPNAIRQLFRTGLFSDVQIVHERIGGNGMYM